MRIKKSYKPAEVLKRILLQSKNDDEFCYEGGDTPDDDKSSDSEVFFRQTKLNENQW